MLSATVGMAQLKQAIRVGMARLKKALIEEGNNREAASSRSEQLKQLRSRCATELEYEIESSKEHWTELDSETSEGLSKEELVAENREVFERLMGEWRCPVTGECFFHDWGDRLKVGAKIAEGGQAEIFAAEFERGGRRRSRHDEIVVKVFKSGYSLKDLERLWPQGMFNPQNSKDPGEWRRGQISTHFIHEYCCFIHGGTLLKNGRFAFVLGKYWGDLRKLIDLKRRESQFYRFRDHEVLRHIMIEIAKGMLKLHDHGILHRDLKASNVLVKILSSRGSYILNDFDKSHKGYMLDVADFESSMGVVGTGFWRAPEVLLALKDQVFGPKTWTEKGDVYSYAMTCYEVMTGRIPFEDVEINVTDVIEGARPLWYGTRPLCKMQYLQNIVISCWHADPTLRPSFREIVSELSREISEYRSRHSEPDSPIHPVYLVH